MFVITTHERRAADAMLLGQQNAEQFQSGGVGIAHGDGAPAQLTDGGVGQEHARRRPGHGCHAEAGDRRCLVRQAVDIQQRHRPGVHLTPFQSACDLVGFHVRQDNSPAFHVKVEGLALQVWYVGYGDRHGSGRLLESN